MLQCNGLVAIPSQPKLQFNPWNNQGFFMSFDVVSQEPMLKKVNIKGSHRVHYYQATIFIPSDRKRCWEEIIKPGEVFLIRTADFSSTKPEGYKFPIAQIKIAERNFLHLKQPKWHK
jgi:hypothetical protein